jgi:phosphoadenosine phosphosulfate reductase
MEDLRSSIKEAVEFIQDSYDGTYFLGFSGGKDSIVVQHLVKKSGVPYEAYYSCTTIDPPEVTRFIRQYYPDVIWLYPRKSFIKLIGPKNPPLRSCRWCCEELKKKPSWKHPLRHRIMGIRHEESPRRSRYPKINQFEKLGITMYYPIIEWKEWMIWEYIERFKLPYPSLYDKGFDRLGCIVCCYHTSKQHEMYRERWPGLFKAFEHAVHRWYDKRKGQEKDLANPSAAAFLEDWYKGKASWYQKPEKQEEANVCANDQRPV